MDLSIFGSLEKTHENISINTSKPVVNDPTLQEGQQHKINEYQKEKTHLKRKRALSPHRLHILRCIIRRYLNPGVPGRRMASIDCEIDDFIDSALQQHDYDIEDLIMTYRSIVPEPKIIYAQCIYCGYMKPFCGC
jgi:hypothetical protein